MESRKAIPVVAVIMLTAALLISAALIGVGIYRVAIRNDWLLLSAGALGVVITLAVWSVIATSGGSDRAESRALVDARLDMIGDRLHQTIALLTRISEQQLISDRAKSVAFREKDRDAIRRAIQEDINRGDFDAALVLSDDFEKAFGYRVEANKFRDEVRNRRQEQVRRQIQEVVEVIDRHTRSEQWNGALREAERLMSMFPDNDQVRGLPQEIDRRRQEYKRRLLESWQEAVARHDTDGSIEILRQLDAYLTPAEATGLEESVRQVFKERREQLAKQFGDAVRDQKWADAIRVGEVIMVEFPESRMSQEVKEKMPVLKQQASGVAAASVLPAGV